MWFFQQLWCGHFRFAEALIDLYSDIISQPVGKSGSSCTPLGLMRMQGVVKRAVCGCVCLSFVKQAKQPAALPTLGVLGYRRQQIKTHLQCQHGRVAVVAAVSVAPLSSPPGHALPSPLSLALSLSLACSLRHGVNDSALSSPACCSIIWLPIVGKNSALAFRSMKK